MAVSRRAPRKLRRRTFNGLGADGAAAPQATRPDYVYDPVSGMILADPSGVLRDQGYEQVQADAAMAVTQVAADTVKKGFEFFSLGTKVLIVGAVLALAVVAVAETRKAFGR